MKKRFKHPIANPKGYIAILVLMTLVGCTPKPQAIDYGKEGCHFCSMTIVDAQHASEIVTKKGKVFKFDAVECMVNFRKTIDPTEVAMYLSNHYTEPVELIDATMASFLISENIPSPMGAFLTAFKTREQAQDEHARSGGELFDWEGLLIELDR